MSRAPSRPFFLVQFEEGASHIWDFLVINNDNLFLGTAQSKLLQRQLEVLIEDFIKQEDYNYSNVATFATLVAENGGKYSNAGRVADFIISEVESALADSYPSGRYE